MTRQLSPVTAILLVLAISPANADCVQWGRTLNGDRICMADDLVNRNPVIPEACGALTGCATTTTTAGPAQKCDEGWTLVLRPEGAWGTAACARELKEPK